MIFHAYTLIMDKHVKLYNQAWNILYTITKLAIGEYVHMYVAEV